jgi:hypothetical protein
MAQYSVVKINRATLPPVARPGWAGRSPRPPTVRCQAPVCLGCRPLRWPYPGDGRCWLLHEEERSVARVRVRYIVDGVDAAISFYRDRLGFDRPSGDQPG